MLKVENRSRLRPALLASTALVLPMLAQAAPQRLVDGGGGPGFAVTGTETRSGEIFTNFVTRGGAGSGGGAGLGGVFFVDRGASLTLDGVSFNTNTVIGGDGGSTPALRFGEVAVGLVESRVPVIEVSQLTARPLLDTGALSFTQIDMGGVNPLVRPGMTLRIGGVEGLATVAAVSGATVTLTAPATVAPFALEAFSPSVGANAGASTLRVADVGRLRVGATLRGPGVAEGTVIIGVTYREDTSAVLTLSRPLADDVADSATLTGVLSSSFEASNVAAASGSSLTLAQPVAGLRPGMVVSGPGIPHGARIESLSGTTITLDRAIDHPTEVRRFEAVAAPMIPGSAEITLPAANGRVVVGMRASGEGVPPGATVTAVDGARVTLSVPVTAAADAITFSSILSVHGAAVTFVNAEAAAGLAPGMSVVGDGVPAGTTVASVNGATVTLSDSPGDLRAFTANTGSRHRTARNIR